MEREYMDRIMESKKYAKMAVKALLSEQALGHVKVIEAELKAMLMECAMDILKQETDEKNNSIKVKKVTID